MISERKVQENRFSGWQKKIWSWLPLHSRWFDQRWGTAPKTWNGQTERSKFQRNEKQCEMPRVISVFQVVLFLPADRSQDFIPKPSTISQEEIFVRWQIGLIKVLLAVSFNEFYCLWILSQTNCFKGFRRFVLIKRWTVLPILTWEWCQMLNKPNWLASLNSILPKVCNG